MKTEREMQQVYQRFFHPEKSPSTGYHINRYTGRIEFTYIPKHLKQNGKVIWMNQGTYIRNKHGEL